MTNIDVQIKARQFSVFYNTHEAVRNVDMDIRKGYVTAIIGPSGCGKSTFLRSINRMNDLVPGARASGSLTLENTDIYDRRLDLTALRQRVGMVFQRPNPFPKSIFDNVAYGPRLKGITKKGRLMAIVEDSLRKSALWDEAKDRLRSNALSMSGGQQQRLCIARALAVQPDVLLMDEPTSALDPKATSHVEELIAELRGQYTMVIVTHNMQQASRVSDETAFFYEGSLIEAGPTEAMFSRPEKEQTEDYITGKFG